MYFFDVYVSPRILSLWKSLAEVNFRNKGKKTFYVFFFLPEIDSKTTSVLCGSISINKRGKFLKKLLYESHTIFSSRSEQIHYSFPRRGCHTWLNPTLSQYNISNIVKSHPDFKGGDHFTSRFPRISLSTLILPAPSI